MPVTPTGPIGKTAAKLRRMVASSASFREAVSAANLAAALQRVFTTNQIGSPTRPHAIVSAGDAFDFQAIAGGSRYFLRPSGSLGLYLARDTPPAYWEDPVQAEYDAWNFFGPVLTEIAELSCEDDPTSPFGESHLPILTITTQGWGENDSEHWESLGRFYFWYGSVRWGDGGS